MENEVVIVSAVRTPIGKFKGSLKDVPAVSLGAITIKNALERLKVQAKDVSEVIFGQGLQGGCGQNPARQASKAAGLGDEVPAMTVNQVCGSGLRSVAIGYQAIMSGDSKVVVCGGQENMTQAPHFANIRSGLYFGDIPFVDSLMHDGLTDAFHKCKMGVTAENIAEKYHISREDQDKFSLSSHHKAIQATLEGRFKNEIVEIESPEKGAADFIKDEHIRSSLTIEKLSQMKPCFTEGRKIEDCTVTAGNTCGINDGAAAVVMMSSFEANKRQLPSLVKIVSWAQAGVDPLYMGIGPVRAIQLAISKSGWDLASVDLFEINEAFASQSLAVIRELNLDEKK